MSYEVTLLVFGILLLLVGLVGKVKAQQLEVGTDNALARGVIAILGAVLVVLSLNPDWARSRLSDPKQEKSDSKTDEEPVTPPVARDPVNPQTTQETRPKTQPTPSPAEKTGGENVTPQPAPPGPSHDVPKTTTPSAEKIPLATPQRMHVGGIVQAARLIKKTDPVYPPLARQARIQGTVKLSAVIAKDGTVSEVKALSGHPMLIPSAISAVKLWRYKPTLLNGAPVEVVTEIDVTFGLSEPKTKTGEP